MKSKVVQITNPTGLDVKPAGMLCKEAMKFKCRVSYRYGNGNIANAKSVLNVLGSSIKHGEEIELICEGEDEVEALAHMVACIEAGLED